MRGDVSFKTSRTKKKTIVLQGKKPIGHIYSDNELTWWFTDTRGHPRFGPNQPRTSLWATTKQKLKDKIKERFLEANIAIYKGERLEDFILKPKDKRTPQEIRREHDKYVSMRVGGRNWNEGWVLLEERKEERAWKNKMKKTS